MDGRRPVLLGRAHGGDAPRAWPAARRGSSRSAFTLLFQRSIQQSLRASLRETQRALRRSIASASRADDETIAMADVVLERRRPAARARSSRCAPASSTRPASGSTATSTSARRCGPATTSCSSTSRASPAGRSASARSSARRSTDVAGILRSLDYAGRVALATSAERGRTGRGRRRAARAVAAGVDERVQAHYWQRYVDDHRGLRVGRRHVGAGAR